MATINKKFEPNNNQEKFLEYILDPDSKFTKKQIADEIGITVHCIYKWYRDQNFVKWLNSFRDRIIENSLFDIYKTSSRKSKAGDYNFSRLLLEMSGDYTPRSESKNLNINKNDGLDKMTEEELVADFKKDLNIYEKSIKKKDDD